MLNISRDLFKSWNEAGLLYCHWKSNEHLLPGLDGKTDLDVLLSRADKKEGERLMRQLNFIQCRSQYGSRYPGVDDWIGFDKKTGALIHIHLHYWLVTGHKGMKEYSLPWVDMALQTRVLNEEYGVYTMEPNLEIITLYTRIGLKADILSLFKCYRGSFIISEDTQREIDWLKARVNMEAVRSLLNIFYGGQGGSVLRIIEREKLEKEDFLKLRKIAESTFRNYRRVKCFVRVREFWYIVYGTYFKKVLRHYIPSLMIKKIPASGQGLIIAFLGQDGAGKTSVTNNLIKWWKWKMDVKYVYLGSGDNYTSWKKKLSRRMPEISLFKCLSFLLTLFDIRDVTRKAYRNILLSEKYAQKGGLVVYDRFPQLIHSGICDGPKIRYRLHKKLGDGFLSRLFMPLADTEEGNIKKIVEHQPNIVIKLLLPPEESIRRKPQENLEAVKKKHEIVKSLKFENCDVYTIDATMPYDEEIIMIKNIIWQHIQK